jgi:hypothetical protein
VPLMNTYLQRNLCDGVRDDEQQRNSEGHLLFEQLPLSAGDLNFRARVEPNQKSAIDPTVQCH